jgi:hypothetical protein
MKAAEVCGNENVNRDTAAPGLGDRLNQKPSADKSVHDEREYSEVVLPSESVWSGQD